MGKGPFFCGLREPDRRAICQASSTAMIPVTNTPSKVPAPPIEATGARNPLMRCKLRRSAPIKVPIVPEILRAKVNALIELYRKTQEL